MMTMKISQERLRELLDYDPETGLFRWRLRPSAPKEWNTKYAGTEAGSINAAGYIVISIDHWPYRAHRLAWLYVHGVLPERLDHRDTVRTHNWIENLREADAVGNAANRKRKNGRVLPKGVSRGIRGRYRATLETSGVTLHLGTFDTAEQASAAYAAAARKHYGEFARAD